MPRRKDKTLPLAAKWMPLIAERLAASSLGMAVAIGKHYDGQVETLRVMESFREVAVNLPKAELWWVSRDMTTLAVDTANDETGFDGDVHWPSTCGFVVFEGGLPLQLEQEKSWYAGSVTVDALFWHANNGGLGILAFSADKDYVARRTWNDPSVPLAEAGIPDDANVALLNRLLAAVWALSAQPTVASVGEGAWDERRDGVRPKALTRVTRPSSNVKLVYLREQRTPRDPSDNDGESGREYACRWIVRGHYRDQACGPRWSEHRRIWVPPYVCGPSDKPLRVKQTVHVWRR